MSFLKPIFLLTALTPLLIYPQNIQNIKVNIDNSKHLNSVKNLLALKEGDAFSQNDLNLTIKRIAQKEYFSHVSGSFQKSSGTVNLEVESFKEVNSIKFASNNKDLNLKLLKESPLAPGDIASFQNLKALESYVNKFANDRGYKISKLVFNQREAPSDSSKIDLVVDYDSHILKYLKEIVFKGFSAERAESFVKSFSKEFKLSENNEHVSATLNKSPLNLKIIEKNISNLKRHYREKNYFDVEINLKENRSTLDDTYSIFLDLKKGPRYDLQITNNTAFWENNLRDLIEEKVINLGLPFSANDSIKILKKKYKENGYKDVKIESSLKKTRTKTTVSFHVSEGKKFFFKGARFIRKSGQHSEVLEKIKDEWLQTQESPYSQIAFDEEKLRSLIPSLLDIIHNYGFIEADIISFKFSKKKKNSVLMFLDLNVRFGARYKMGEILVSEELNQSYETKIQKIKKDHYYFNRNVIKSLIRKITQEHYSFGYLDVEVDLSPENVFIINPRSRAIDIALNFKKGKKIIFGKLIPTGLKSTKEKVIQRELGDGALEEGKTWTPERKQKLDERLYSLGLFKSLNFQSVTSSSPFIGKDNSEIRDLKLELTERPGGALEFGPGYRTDLGVIGFTEFNYRNLGGWNRGLHMRAQVSRKLSNYQFLEQNYSLVYIEPFPLERRALLRAEIEYKKDDDLQFNANGEAISGFNLEEVTFDLRLEKPLLNNYLFIWNIFNYSLPKLTDIVDSTDSDLQKYKIGTIGAELRIDYRDDIFNPKTGFFISNEIQYSSPLLRSTKDAHFTHYSFLGNYYLNVLKDAVLAFSLGYQRIWGLGDSSGIPENRRIVLGGRDSLRSLPTNFLRFDDEGVLGQESYNARIEYRVPLFDGWGIAPFAEGARIDILKSKEKISSKSTGLRLAGGFSFRYVTPVGPISVDIAKNIDPQEDEDDVRLELSIGSF